MVLADHGVPDELEHAHQRVADDSRAEVPDVHLLGDVRCRVVDHDALGRRCPPHPEAIVVFQDVELLLQEGFVERDVDETGSGHFDAQPCP